MKTYQSRAASGSEPWHQGEKRLFPLGFLVTTPGIISLLEEHGENADALQPFLRRHQSGDWGELDEADKAENNLSVAKKYRILSAYHLFGEKIWLITEADRSSTTVLLPSEY